LTYLELELLEHLVKGLLEVMDLVLVVLMEAVVVAVVLQL
jgi:hypothetical protein